MKFNNPSMILKNVFNSFCEELQKRNKITSEDTIRYYWYASMLEKDRELKHYTMEAPYNSPSLKKKRTVSKKELDLLYENEIEQWAIEIKFHRNPSKKTYACPDAAGSLIGDIVRLPYFKMKTQKETKRLMLYVTDSEMHEYLGNSSNLSSPSYRLMLKKFYDLELKKIFSFPTKLKTNEKRTKTFYYSVYESFNNQPKLFSCQDVRLLAKADFKIQNSCFKDKECHVRLYEVLDVK